MTLLEILLKYLDEWPKDADYCYQQYFGRTLHFHDEAGGDVKRESVPELADCFGPYNKITRQEFLAGKRKHNQLQKGEDMNNLAAYAHALELLRKFEEHISATMPEGEGYVPFEQLKIDLEWHYNLKPAVAEMSKSIDWEDYDHEDKETILRVLKDVAKAGFRKQEK